MLGHSQGHGDDGAGHVATGHVLCTWGMCEAAGGQGRGQGTRAGRLSFPFAVWSRV